MKVELSEFTAKGNKDTISFTAKYGDSCFRFILMKKEIEFLIQEDPEFIPAFADLSTFIYIHHNYITIVPRGQEWIEIPFRWKELAEVLGDLTFLAEDKEYNLITAYQQSQIMAVPKTENKTSQTYIEELVSRGSEDKLLEGLGNIEKLAARYSEGQDDPIAYIVYPDFKDIGFSIYNREGRVALSGGLIKYNDGTYHIHT